jgi:ATP-dependent helicase HrpB
MVIDMAGRGAAHAAADIALVLGERGLGGTDVDLVHRLDQLRRDRSRRAADARRMAGRWADIAAAAAPVGRGGPAGEVSAGVMLALAFPDRIARSRGTETGSFLLANGRGAAVDPASALAREKFLSVAELAGSAGQSRILLAAAITPAEIDENFAARIETRDEVLFDPRTASLRGRRTRRLGAIVLAEQTMTVASDAAAAALCRGILALGLDRLPWTTSLRQWRDRVVFLRGVQGEEWPDLSDAGLMAAAEEWLAPALAGKTALGQLSADELTTAVTGLVPWKLRARLEQEAPTHFAAPSGSRVAIDYAAAEGPKLSVRVQELFGLDRHPAIAGGRVPLVVELLSPAHRPVQITRDLPGFWRGSYAAVKAEMKGRYPRHPWPDDPLAAPATRRAKPRGT